MIIPTLVVIFYVISHASGTYVCMYAKGTGERCGACFDDYTCSGSYASVDCMEYMIAEESFEVSSQAECEKYTNAVNGYTSNDMSRCDTGVPRFLRAIVAKVYKDDDSISGDSVTWDDIQDKINTYIYEKGLDALEEAACVALTKGVAAAFCKSPVFKIAMDCVEDLFIDPLLQDIVVDGLGEIQDGIADAIADGAREKAHKRGQESIYTTADETECDGAMNHVGFNPIVVGFAVLLCVYIVFPF